MSGKRSRKRIPSVSQAPDLSLEDSGAQNGGETVIAYVNGQRYQGDPRAISLGSHAVIQLAVGADVPPVPYTFPSDL